MSWPTNHARRCAEALQIGAGVRLGHGAWGLHPYALEKQVNRLNKPYAMRRFVLGKEVLVAERLGYALPTGRRLFSGVTFSLEPELVGIVGPNGGGKSTLLRILAGELSPSEGKVRCVGRVGYMPQDERPAESATVADMLASPGNMYGGRSESDSGSAWARDRDSYSHELGLGNIDLNALASHCSGGQLTRLSLLRTLLDGPSILLLDEPTNNLDSTSRAFISRTLAKWNGGVLVVSHDRKLLEQMDRILELGPDGVTSYGGGYELYEQQSALARAAQMRSLQEAEATVAATRRSAQRERERKERSISTGRERARRTGASRLEIGAAKDRSSKSAKRNNSAADDRLHAAEQRLAVESAKVNARERLNFDVTGQIGGGVGSIVTVSDFSFAYRPDASLFAPITFSLPPGGRLGIEGDSGVGKSTLLRVIAGVLKGGSGLVSVRARGVAYLDQHFSSVLDEFMSVLQNFQRCSPDLAERECRARLARFLFRNQDAMKQVAVLSGGEKLRAALACVLGAQRVSDLILLDEPTNNLDLASIRYLEEALTLYPGAIIAVSHDTHFLKNIGCEDRVELSWPQTINKAYD